MNSWALSPLYGQQGSFKRSQMTLHSRDCLSMELVTVRWDLTENKGRVTVSKRLKKEWDGGEV